MSLVQFEQDKLNNVTRYSSEYYEHLLGYYSNSDLSHNEVDIYMKNLFNENQNIITKEDTPYYQFLKNFIINFNTIYSNLDDKSIISLFFTGMDEIGVTGLFPISPSTDADLYYHILQWPKTFTGENSRTLNAKINQLVRIVFLNPYHADINQRINKALYNQINPSELKSYYTISNTQIGQLSDNLNDLDNPQLFPNQRNMYIQRTEHQFEQAKQSDISINYHLPCPFGHTCFRKNNPEHTSMFSHHRPRKVTTRRQHPYARPTTTKPTKQGGRKSKKKKTKKKRKRGLRKSKKKRFLKKSKKRNLMDVPLK